MDEFTYVATAVIQKAVDVVVTAHLISSGCISIYVVTAVSLNGGCCFPDFVTSLFQKAVDLVLHVLSLHF